MIGTFPVAFRRTQTEITNPRKNDNTFVIAEKGGDILLLEESLSAGVEEDEVLKAACGSGVSAIYLECC